MNACRVCTSLIVVFHVSQSYRMTDSTFDAKILHFVRLNIYEGLQTLSNMPNTAQPLALRLRMTAADPPDRSEIAELVHFFGVDTAYLGDSRLSRVEAHHLCLCNVNPHSRLQSPTLTGCDFV